MKIKYLPAKYKNKVINKYPNAGPRCNITGMKKIWNLGKKESITVICGNYLYFLGYELTGETATIYNMLAY